MSKDKIQIRSKTKKVRKLMDLIGLTAMLKQDFNILIYPLGLLDLPSELVHIDIKDEEHFLDRFAKFYGEYWNGHELDEAITFLTDNPCGRKLMDPFIKNQATEKFIVFMTRKIQKIKPKHVSIIAPSPDKIM